VHVRALVTVVPVALIVGCSLIVDTSGLAEVDRPLASGDAASDAPGPSPADGGDANAVDAAADAADGASGPCPGGRGPAMVQVKDVYGTFCIDATEVTNTQFNAFLADSARPTPPATCAYRTTYGGATRPADALPVTDVDWCEAWMFCAWSGKRLCGSRNGTRINDFPVANDKQVSEWFAACSGSGNTKYPYGDVAAAQRCNGCDRTNSCATDAGIAAPVAVGSLACEGGYPGIFDLAGNVGEWEDSCDPNPGAEQQATCPRRGGDRTLASADLTCAMNSYPLFSARGDRSSVTGIRCCAN
jgi:formylglycine-generating enzyme required for sulfatase activity